MPYQPCRPGREEIRRKSTHTPLSSGCWVSGSAVLLSNCKSGVSRLSKVVLISDCIAVREEKTLRPSPGTNMAEMRTGTCLPALSTMYPQMVPVAVANTFLFPLVMTVFGSFSCLQYPPHAFPQSWNQLFVYRVIRRAAVHNRREPVVAVGLKTPVAATSEQPCKRESPFEIVVEVEGRLFVVVGGACARALYSRDSVSASTLRWAWRSLLVAFRVVVRGSLDVQNTT